MKVLTMSKKRETMKQMTTITLTADRAALCVRTPYAHREKMLSISPHLRRGVRDGTGFWWRLPLHAYGIVAFVLPDVSVDYDVFVALDGVNTARELLRYKASLQKMPTSKQDKSQVLAIAPMLTDDPEKKIAFREVAKKKKAKIADDSKSADNKRQKKKGHNPLLPSSLWHP